MSATAVGPAPGRPGADERRPTSRGVQVLGALVAGGATYAAVSAGLLPAALSLVLAALVLVLLPTASGASARIALNGSVVLGWSPVLWWVRLPLDVNHGALLLAAGVAALAVLGARGPASLLPAWRRSDLVPVAAGVVALVAVHDLALARSPRRALEVLLPGADNYVHFHLFTALRLGGAALDVAPGPADGSGWSRASYPTGFHTVVATVSELTHPAWSTGPGSVLAYAHAVAIVLVLAMVVLAAALVSLPRVADRPGVALPAVTLVAAAFLWEPGQKILANGFASFWLGALAVGTALVLSVHSERAHSVPHAVAIAGLVVLVAHTWTLLLVPMLPVGLVLLRGRRGHPGDRRRLGWCVAVFALAGLGVVKAALAVLSEVSVGFLVSATGGLNGTSPLPTFTLIVVSLAVLPLLPALVRAHGRPADVLLAVRARRLVLAPVLGVGLAAALLVAQLRSTGTTSYYFLKYLMGLELVLAVVVAAGAALLVSLTTERDGRRRALLLVLLATAAASQAFGPVLGRTGLLLDDRSGGTASVDGRYSRTGLADGLVAVAARVPQGDAVHLDYLATGSGTAAEAFYPDAWFHGLTGTLSHDAEKRVDLLRVRVLDPASAAGPVRDLLEVDERTRVVVDPDAVAGLRAVLAPDLRDRVVGWDCVSGSCG